MASAARLLRLATLERLLACDRSRLREQAAQQRQERWHQGMLRLVEAFPSSTHEQLVECLSTEGYQGLRTLVSYVMNGVWQGQSFPLEVASIYLHEPQATPGLRCLSCHLLLPYRRGFWRNTTTRQWWQAPLTYFETCPACQGRIGYALNDDPFSRSAWLPVRPAPPWEFLDELPT